MNFSQMEQLMKKFNLKLSRSLIKSLYEHESLFPLLQFNFRGSHFTCFKMKIYSHLTACSWFSFLWVIRSNTYFSPLYVTTSSLHRLLIQNFLNALITYDLILIECYFEFINRYVYLWFESVHFR